MSMSCRVCLEEWVKGQRSEAIATLKSAVVEAISAILNDGAIEGTASAQIAMSSQAGKLFFAF